MRCDSKPAIHSQGRDSRASPLDNVKSFFGVLTKADSYRVEIAVCNIVEKTGFETNARFDLAIDRPDKARFWLIEGVGGPMILTDGVTLQFWMRSIQRPQVVTSAPASISLIDSEVLLGSRAATLLRNNPVFIAEFLKGQPSEIIDRYLLNARYLRIVSIDSRECYMIRSETNDLVLDAWFEIVDSYFLRRLELRGKKEGRGIVHRQDYKCWQLNCSYPDKFFESQRF